MLRTLFLLFVVWCLAGVARADTAFIMVPGVETERIAPDVQAQVLKATRAALRAHGVTVISLDEAKKLGVACAGHECVIPALDKLKADYGVLVTMMTTPEETAALGSVGVEFYHRDLVYEGESVRVLDHGIERAIDESIRAARAAQRRGPGPWVIAQGTPPDVELYQDGKRVDDGDLPSEIRVSPDQMLTITAKREGYRSREFNITIGSNLASTYKLQVSLAVESAAAYPHADAPDDALPANDTAPIANDQSPKRKVPTWKDWTLGSALVGGGILIAINPLRTLANQDERPYDDNRRVEAGPRTKGLLVLGSALVVGGVLIPLWIKPFGIQVGTTTEATTLQVHGAF